MPQAQFTIFNWTIKSRWKLQTMLASSACYNFWNFLNSISSHLSVVCHLYFVCFVGLLTLLFIGHFSSIIHFSPWLTSWKIKVGTCIIIKYLSWCFFDTSWSIQRNREKNTGSISGLCNIPLMTSVDDCRYSSKYNPLTLSFP